MPSARRWSECGVFHPLILLRALSILSSETILVTVGCVGVGGTGNGAGIPVAGCVPSDAIIRGRGDMPMIAGGVPIVSRHD